MNKFKTPKNENYCATVVEITNIVPMFTKTGEPCSSIQSTTIFGNTVIIGKDTKIGDTGLFFPVETKIANGFLHENSLYRDTKLNKDETHKGLFEENGRIRCQKLQGVYSMGFFCPVDYLQYIYGKVDGVKLNPFALKAGSILIQLGDTFDEINEIVICEKYIPKVSRTPGEARNKNMGKVKRVSKLVDNQFRLHYDTSQLGKNMHCFTPDSLVSITRKLHGTSVIISEVLVKKKLTTWQKIMQFFGADIITTEYGNIYSSRRVVQNQFEEGEKEFNSYYGGSVKLNVYKLANDTLKEFLQAGMTVYAEIVGYTTTGGFIQKPFDYGCVHPEELFDKKFIVENDGMENYGKLLRNGRDGKHSFKIFIYRITYTNVKGEVFEFSAKQVQTWCKLRGLNAVPELYYGKMGDIFPELSTKEHWHENMLEALRNKYLEVDCEYCKNHVPAEGIVVRDDISNEAFKYKSKRFLELESKTLDKGEADMEETGEEV